MKYIELKNQSLMEGVKIYAQAMITDDTITIHLRDTFQHKMMKDYRALVKQLLNEMQEIYKGDALAEKEFALLKEEILHESNTYYKKADAWYSYYIGSGASMQDAFCYLAALYDAATSIGAHKTSW